MPKTETAVLPPTPVKKISAQKIFGSNLFLNNRLLVSTPAEPYASLREARQNFSEKTFCTQLVRVDGIEPSASKLSVWRSTTELHAHGAPTRDRTSDLFNVNETLYH